VPSNPTQPVGAFVRVAERSPPAGRPAQARAFVSTALISFFALLGLVLVLNTVADPFALAGTGLLPTAVESDREIKLNLIDSLDEPPGILILGSSRARQAEPAYLERLTGRSGFNAGVTAGTAADAWVLTNYLDQKHPLHGRGYVWFVDVGIATHGVSALLAADRRAQPYLDQRPSFGLDEVAAYLAPDATLASLRVIKSCLLLRCHPQDEELFLRDGAIKASALRSLPEYERAEELDASLDRFVQRLRARPPRGRRIVPRRLEYFEKTLAYMNEHGSTPVIVLNPTHPVLLAELRKRGHPDRAAALRYLESLQARYDFVFVDAEDIRVWGGSPADFANANHVNRRNMRRMLDYVVAHSQGALD
jgi:hypothetical protein